MQHLLILLRLASHAYKNGMFSRRAKKKSLKKDGEDEDAAEKAAMAVKKNLIGTIIANQIAQEFIILTCNRSPQTNSKPSTMVER